MIRKLASGEYRIYSRKLDPRTGKRRNLGTFRTRAAARSTSARSSSSSARGSTAGAPVDRRGPPCESPRMSFLSCPVCGGRVAPVAAGCVHCGHVGMPRPQAAAVAHKVAGYLLEAATLLPLFRMTMPDAAHPTWSGSWGIVGALVVAALAFHWLGRRAGRSVPASEWGARPAARLTIENARRALTRRKSI